MKNRYDTKGDVTVIYLNYKGQVVETSIDTEDLPKVDSALDHNTWIAHWSVERDRFYATGKRYLEGKEETLFMHRVVMDCGRGNGMVIDHINHDTLDNRKSNLCIVSNAENLQNRGSLNKNNKSGIRGVCWDKHNLRWVGYVKVQGKKHYVGSWKEITKDTKRMMDDAYKKLHLYTARKGE